MARGQLVWYNGEVRKVQEAKISLFTHSLHYGVGAFEGIRAYKQTHGGGAVFRLPEHIQRFVESFKILGFDLPYSHDQLCQASVEISRANGFQECYIRPIAFTADGPMGVDPGEKPPIDVAILNWEWGSYLGDRGITEGANLLVSSFNRPHPNSVMTRGKITGQYVTGVIAKRQARSLGFDEALFLDTQGYLSEGSGENLFIIRDGVVKTTPVTTILEGITRKTVISYLRSKGYTVEEQLYTRETLWCADEAFLTGTAAEITPVASVDRRTIGPGRPGPVTKMLQKDYMALVRGDLPEYRKWLTPI